MLSILAGAALGVYTLKTALGLSKDVAVTKAVKNVKSAVHDAIVETKAGIAQGFEEGRARARAAKAQGGESADELMAKVFAQANDDEKQTLVSIISKYAKEQEAA